MLIGAAIVTLGLNNAQFLAGIAESEGAFGRLNAIGPLALAAVATGVVAAGVAVVKMAGNFEQSTNTLITSAGLSRGSIDAVRQGILQMSVDTATSTDQLVAGMFNVQSALHLGVGGLQVLKAAAEGAKAENSDLAQTTDVLTTAMVNYHLSAAQAVPTMNSLIAVVADGKMHMNDLTGALKNVLPVSAAFHIGLSDVEGALATMANAGDRGTSAGTHLAMMFKMLSSPTGTAKNEMAAMGLDSIKLAQTMQTSLPGALQMIQSAVSKHFTPGSVEYNRAILAILGGSKSGAAGLEIFNQGLGALRKNTGDAAGALHSGSKNVENWSTIQSGFNFKLDAAKNVVGAVAINLGTKLLPALGNLLGVIPNIVSYVSNFKDHSNVLIPILAGIGAVIAVVLVPAVWSLAAGVIAATWPLLLIGAVVAGLVAIFMHFYQTNAGFKAFIDNLVTGFKQVASFVIANFIPAMKQIGTFFMNNILPVLRQIGGFLVSTFAPVWQQLQQVWNGSILPALKQLWSTFQMLLPVLKFVGEVIGGVLVVGFGIMVGLITGIVKALAGFLSGLAVAFGGLVQMFTGIVQFVSGIVKFLYDLLTGNFGALQGDLAQIWAGIVNIFSGAWNMIKGIFMAAWGAISGLVSGFVQGIVGFFTWLWNTLVGHSIIPDMITGIINFFASLPGKVFNFVSRLVIGVVSFFLALAQQAGAKASQLITTVVDFFAQLPGRAISAVTGLIGRLASFFGGLAGQAVGWGANIIKQLASGIIGSIGSAIGGAMSAVGSFIHNYLPHSPAKLGPLRDLPMQSAMISQQIAAGIIAGSPKIQAAMSQALHPIALSMGTIGVSGTGSSVGISSTSSASGGTREIHIHMEMNGRELSHAMVNDMGDALVKHMRVRVGMRA